MSDLSYTHSPFVIVKQPDAKNLDGTKCPIIRCYPGRSVSVQFGLPSPNNNTATETRTRIILLLDVAVVGGGACPPPLCDARFGRLQGPSVIVLAAGERDIFEAFISEQTVTLFVEARFLRETASSDVTSVTVGDLAELGRKDALVAQVADIFRTLSRRAQRPNSLYVESLGTVMAAHVQHYLCDGEAPADRRGGLPTDALQRVVGYIDDHCAEEFDADALARVSGYSRNHFQRLFKKSFNQTPREYVRGCQVEHAIALLQTTNSKGLDVALACGFCDETQMARWFWKLRRCLPGQVREAMRW